MQIRKSNSLITLWCFVVITLMAAPVWGAQGARSKKSRGLKKDTVKQEPITITSDRMAMDQKKNSIQYKGNVVAVRGDVTLKSDTLTATYNPLAKRIDKVIAQGNLVVTQGDRVATGNRAVFSIVKNTVTLTGKPSVSQGNSQVSGTRIILYLNEDRGIVEGGKERVKAVIFPDELDAKDLGGKK